MSSRKTAIVTGGTGGLGQALCHSLARDGYNILALYRSDDSTANNLIDAVRRHGVEASAVRCDLGTATSLELSLPVENDELILVHNAVARFVPQAMHLTPVGELDAQWAVAVRGFSLCVNTLLRPMARAKRSTMVTVGTRALHGDPPRGFGAYTAAKSALASLTRSVAVEYAARGVRVFMVSPGFMRTTLTDGWDPALREAVASTGESTPATVAARIAQLIADPTLAARGESHDVLRVDGHVMSELSPMAPAFSSPRQAMGFGLLVGVLLALPAILRVLDLPGHDNRLSSSPVRAGPVSFDQHEIYEDDTPLDLAVVGDSMQWADIDTPAIARALGEKLGRPARVVTIAWNYHGEDLTYYALRDLLARRSVSAVMLRLNHATKGSGYDRPHPHSFRWLTACMHDPVIGTLPLPYRMSVYGIEMTGALRNLLSLVRPNQLSPSPYAQTLGAQLAEVGTKTTLFVRLVVAPKTLPVTQVLSTLGAQEAQNPDHNPHGAYQRGYVGAARALLAQHHVPVIFVRAPKESEARQTTLASDGLESEVHGVDTPVLVPSPAALFSGLTDREVHELYTDDNHLNHNGAEYFTATITPALLEFYGNAIHAP